MDPISTPWLILMAYWLITVFKVRPNQSVEAPASRLIRLAVVILGFELLYGHWFKSSWLGKRFVPDLYQIRYSGIALVWIGVGIAIWARYHLGEYWSGKVTIKTDHKLINTGPYEYVRHPIYSGILLALAGTALAIGAWRGIAAFLLMLVVFLAKIQQEERMLTAQLGEGYLEFKRRTGMLIPRPSLR
jgi:protein-S-isoprenylcysteine O-methyltransferase Ste14